ncbi:hypothetical protein [Pectobacterium polaris]|nr:hypothetical protein [Pectobacterium polaris]
MADLTPNASFILFHLAEVDKPRRQDDVQAVAVIYWWLRYDASTR